MRNPQPDSASKQEPGRGPPHARAPAPHRSARRRSVPILLTALVLLLVAHGVLRTRTGWRWLEVRLNHALGPRVQLAGLRGQLPWRGACASVRVLDTDGVWLTISNATWDTGPRALLHRAPLLRQVQAERVDVLRAPTPAPQRTQRRAARLPRLRLPSVTILALHLPADRGGAHTGPLHVQAEGVLAARTLVGTAVVRGHALAGTAQGRVALRDDGPAGHVRLHYRETAAGPLTVRWSPDAARGVSASVFAKGRGQTWSGGATLHSARGQAFASWRATPGATVETTVTFHDLAVPVGEHSASVSFAHATWTVPERTGSLEVSGQLGDAPIELEATLRHEAGAGLHAPHIVAHSPGLRAEGRVDSFRDRVAQATVTFETNAAAWGFLPGDVVAAGNVGLAVTGFVATARMELERAATPWGSAETLTGSATLDASGETRVVHVRARTGRWQAGRLEGHHAEVEARGSPSAVRLETLIAEGANWNVRLQEPVDVAISTQSVTWSMARLSIPGAELWTVGTLTPERVDIRAQLEPVALDALNLVGLPALSGTLSASLACSGTAAAPEVTAHVQAVDVLPRAPLAIDARPAELDVLLRFKDDTGSLAVTLSGWTPEPLRAHVATHANVSLYPWTFSVPTNGALRGNFRADADLAALEGVLDLRGTALHGRLHAALELAGTVAQPEVRGALALVEGSLEHPGSGLLLEDMELIFEGDQQQIAIRSGKAHDGTGGRVALAGSLQFLPAAGFPLDLRMDFERACVWRAAGSRVLLQGWLSITGRLAAAQMQGSLQIPDAEWVLAPRRPSIPRLPVEGLPAGSVSTTRMDRATWLARIGLDVALATTDTLRVRGRGLDSDWVARAQINGTADRPRVVGTLDARRGNFMFMGRRFLLDRAWIETDGQYPPRPTLDIGATSRGSGLLARLHAFGPADEPQIELTSDPPYPMEEILARLLFSRSAQDVSAFQAARLAYGLNLLRGKGNTLDLLEHGQSRLHVDHLRLQLAEGEEALSSVAVGKHFGRRLYVQGEQQLNDASQRLAVELELTRSLILQTESTPGIREGIKLQWRRDY